MIFKTKTFTRVQLNVLMAVAGAAMFMSGGIITFARDLSSALQIASLAVVAVGLVFVIIASLIHVESDDERSRENAAAAGNDTALVMQFILTLLAAVGILLKIYVQDYFNSNTIFMLLGILIFTRSVAFIRHEKAGE
jgi:putative Ca2+/H+ antiporter (TMEM165/GDT1 family)